MFVVAPSEAAQLYNLIGSFPAHGYAANAPSVCLSRPLVIQNAPTQVFKGDVRLSGESRNPRHPPPQPPRRSGRQPNQSQKSLKSNESQFKTKRPPTSHHTTTPPVFPAKPGTHAPSPPSVYPRVAVDATPPNRRSGESQNLRHPPTATPSKVRTATNQSQKSLKSNESQFKTKRPPPATTQPPHPSFQRNPQPTHPPPQSTRRSVYPRVAVDATPPTRLSAESRNPRTPQPQPLSKVRAATKPIPKITQIKRIPVQDQAPPTSHHTTTPTRLSSETRQPIPHSALPIPNSPDTRHFPTPNTPPYHNVSQTRNVPPGHADQIQPATEATRCTDVRKSR